MSIYLGRIGIQNFRTFGAFDVEVPAAPGLILLTGTNGLGKSSFFDAIEWGLTGTIRRFTPYLNKGRKKLVESDYLTRRGADSGSHEVVLTFSDGEPIERSIKKTTAMASIIAKLARSDRRAIEDLSTYLALTHFLGQAAQQRFTSREAPDQWRAIKGPSGLERLEQIRSGLRGRAVVAAFTRRLEQERANVSALERQIADWQGWTARLVRLQQAARATGALTPDEVLERTQALEAELDGLLGGSANPISGDSTSRRLATLGDNIGDALRNGSARLAGFAALDDLPAAYTRVFEGARSDQPVLLRLRQSVSEAQAAAERATSSLETADKAVVDQNAAIAEIEQEIRLLQNVTTDIARRDQLAAQIDTAQRDVTEAGTAIATKRAVFEQADDAINRYGEAAANVAKLRHEAETTGARLNALPTLMDLEEQAGRLAAEFAAARDAASVARGNLDSLIAERTSLEAEIAEAGQARAEAVRHASAISEALAGLASHIHEDDTNCPVCSTPFAPGVLKLLVDSAASTSDNRMTDADDKLERLRARHTELATLIAVHQSIVDAPMQRERDARSAANALTDARAALTRVLGVEDTDDLHAIVREQNRSAMLVLADAVKALEPLAALAAQYANQRETLTTESEDLIVRQNQVQARLDAFRAEDKACIDRVAARGWAESSLERVNQRLTNRRKELESARAQLVRLTDIAAAAKTALGALRAELFSQEQELAAADSARAAAEATSNEMSARWARAGLDGQPSQAGLDKAKGTLSDQLNAFRTLTERQLVLARDNEDTLLQAEVVQVLKTMRQAGGEGGVADPAAFLAGLQAKATAARDAIKLTNATRLAVGRYSQELKTEADDFASRVLDPLNVVIDDFNEAMLSTPGETIQFKADTRIDATSFGMALRYRDQVEHAIEIQKDLPPQVVLSEGQLAANGFSILCAASTAYPWSTWRALLLDDPLQHNDIIHTAAFVDVMRNMVELEGYQLIMSSHDRAESEFIARKFDAAGLPCTTIMLTSPSDKGVVWDPPLRNAAANRILRRRADEHLSDSA